MELALFTPEYPFPPKTQQEGEEDEQSYQRHRDFVATLPAYDGWPPLRKYQGFWFLEYWLPATLAAREHFVARPSDILLTSVPKSGTTWLMSMVFSLIHRHRHPPHDEGHPLRHANPHHLVPYVEELYRWSKNPDLTALPSPRIFATHIPYSMLPQSVKVAGCRIIHVARDPKDVFVSAWFFWKRLEGEESAVPGGNVVSLDDAFHMFCSGVTLSGPIWEHTLEYWNEHLRRPHRVMSLKYEAMKEDPVGSLKNLAAFLGCPFSADEEERRLPEAISDLCSFKNLSNLSVNKGDVAVARTPGHRQNHLFFRKGEVGDWANLLTPEMADKLDSITREKLRDSGLSF